MITDGFERTNKAGEVVIRFAQVELPGCDPYWLCVFRPRKADGHLQMHEVLSALETAKRLLKVCGLRLFDSAELFQRVEEYFRSTDYRLLPTIDFDHITVNATDIASGEMTKVDVSVADLDGTLARARIPSEKGN